MYKLTNNAIYEHKCLENIKKLYKQAGKCDEHKKFKDILVADMIYNPEGFINNSPISPMKPKNNVTALKYESSITSYIDIQIC